MIKSTITVKTVRTFDVDDLGDMLWSGALDRWNDATDEQREAVFERILDYFYDEVEDESINDFVWFDCDDIFFPEEDEDKDNEKDNGRYFIVYSASEIQYGQGKDSGLFLAGNDKYDDVVKAAMGSVMNDDYEKMDSYETLEEAQEALKDHVSYIYELTNGVTGKHYVYARMCLLVHFNDDGYEIEGTSPVHNELVNDSKDEDNEE